MEHSGLVPLVFLFALSTSVVQGILEIPEYKGTNLKLKASTILNANYLLCLKFVPF